jgi:hypothetical protein
MRQLKVMTVCPVDREADRYPVAVGEDAALGANLAAVRGVLAHLFPPSGGFRQRSIHRQPGPVNALQGVIVHEALFPQGHEDIGRRPLLEMAMGRTTGTAARLVQRLPLAARTEYEKDGIHRFAIIDARPMAPQRVRFARWEQGHDTLPQLVRDTPVTAGFLVIVMHQHGS